MNADGIVYYSVLPELGEERRLAMQILKWGFSEFFGMEFQEENIKRNGYGKPYYDCGQEQIQFNLSHCRDAVAVVVSRRRVGVDVEGMRSVNYRTVIKCCSAEELSYVMGRDVLLVQRSSGSMLQGSCKWTRYCEQIQCINHSESDTYEAAFGAKEDSCGRGAQLLLPCGGAHSAGVKSNVVSEAEAKRFLQLWTLKESYVKMTGEGLRRKLNQVNFTLTDAHGIWKQEVQTVAGNQADCRHFLYSPGKFVAALTTEHAEDMPQAEFLWKEYKC